MGNLYKGNGEEIVIGTNILSNKETIKKINVTIGNYHWNLGTRDSNSRYYAPESFISCVNGQKFIIDNVYFGSVVGCVKKSDGTFVNLTTSDLTLIGNGTSDLNKYTYVVGDSTIVAVIFQCSNGGDANKGNNFCIYADKQNVQVVDEQYLEPYDFATKSYVSTAIANGGISKVVDLVVFAGQSNMAGRGTASQAPSVDSGIAYEFRAISDATKLYDISEPFGKDENNSTGINDGTKKTGSMVSAFVNSMYAKTKIPIIAVSASVGGSASGQWVSGSSCCNDMCNRITSAISYLTENGYAIKNKVVVWFQGESDADGSVSEDTYKTNILSMWNALKLVGMESLLMFQIGKYDVADSKSEVYKTIRTAQSNLCKENENIVMLTMDAITLYDRGMTNTPWHYNQKGYNELGKIGGSACADYIMSGKEPIIFDTDNDILFYTSRSV